MAQPASASVPLFGIAAAPSQSRSALSLHAVDASIGAAGHAQFFQPVPAQLGAPADVFATLRGVKSAAEPGR